jgi:UDP-N-acetylmuramoyl-tripeptide--D-alanyl-D-alanine ligase
MKQPTLDNLQAATGGRLLVDPDFKGNLPLGEIVTDSRRAVRDVVFWTLKGNRFNGSDFIDEALRRGARGIVTDRLTRVPRGGWALMVDDTKKALNDWARWHRDQFRGTVIGVAGSVGKTTTRQMIDRVLGTRFSGMASPKNYNNHFGVPLSLLKLKPYHDYAVLELGASHVGEIRELAKLARPDWGVVTTVAEAHLGSFGSRDAIREAKSELLDALPSSGRAFMVDSKATRQMASRSAAPVGWVGCKMGDRGLVAERISVDPGEVRFIVNGYPFRIPVWGAHHVSSALLAISVGLRFGLPLSKISAALARFEMPEMRCQVSDLHGVTVINDAYNSNPTAMRAALELLGQLETEGRRVVVMGDMAELGDQSGRLHYQIGREVVERSDADLLIACGEFARETVAGARSSGMPRVRSIPCRTPEEAIPFLSQAVRYGDMVLVKGARFMQMERVIDALEQFPLRYSA